MPKEKDYLETYEWMRDITIRHLRFYADEINKIPQKKQKQSNVHYRIMRGHYNEYKKHLRVIDSLIKMMNPKREFY